MSESTDLGQDREKIADLVCEIVDLIDKYYPNEQITGKDLMEILDALAAATVYHVTTAPEQLVATFKKYFSQRLVEIEAQTKELE